MRNQKILVLFLVSALFAVLLNGNLKEKAKLGRLNQDTVTSNEFRIHDFTEEAADELRNFESKNRGIIAGLYLLQRGEVEDEKAFFREENLRMQKKIWEKRPAWKEYAGFCEAVWNDVTYFPVPVSSRNKKYQVSYVDSWMSERTFGGKRGHEGCDIMASEDKPGLYPVISMTDGVVENMGWLEKGGYRIGIRAPLGGYFYYAHLDCYADLKEKAEVKAGDVLGFMGNSGYGPEGTKGMFATHLHLGIYIYPDGKEVSINPYWILRTIEEKKLSCSF